MRSKLIVLIIVLLALGLGGRRAPWLSSPFAASGRPLARAYGAPEPAVAEALQLALPLR